MPDDELIYAQRVAHEIQKYLQNRPNSADTVKGVMEWWISRQRFEETLEVTAKALDILEREGIVKKVISVDGSEIYRLLQE